MGNQSSISTDKYEMRKIKKPEKLEKIKVKKASIPEKNYEKQHIRNEYKEHRNNNSHHIPREQPHIIQNNNNNIYDKNVNRQYSNNAIIERNTLNELYNQTKKNIIFDYPTNSNNELIEPKKSFDNIKFTPYNFNDEINKFKKNIEDERTTFENEEKTRRNNFEKTEKDRQTFLNKQVKYFESNYNPWEILGLEYNDLSINNIKKAYKKGALKYHPDKAGDKYQDKFQLITQAYLYLLSKAENDNEINNKVNRKVEKMDYEDNINQNVENIYISKDNFDVNQFNTIFEKYKVPSAFDKGYSDLMKQDIAKQSDEIFGKNFNKDIFNAHFDNVKKNKKNSDQLIVFQEPNALDISLSNLNQFQLGMEDEIEDFGSVNAGGLCYTDYKKAHVDEPLLIDVSKVKYKTYNSIEQLENERSKISHDYIDNIAEKRRQEELDQKRMSKQREYDNYMESHYNRLNQRLIVHK